MSKDKLGMQLLDVRSLSADSVIWACLCGNPLGAEMCSKRKTVVTCPGCKRRMKVTATIHILKPDVPVFVEDTPNRTTTENKEKK